MKVRSPIGYMLSTSRGGKGSVYKRGTKVKAHGRGSRLRGKKR